MPWEKKEEKNRAAFIVHLSSSTILYNDVIHILTTKNYQCFTSLTKYDQKWILMTPKNVWFFFWLNQRGLVRCEYLLSPTFQPEFGQRYQDMIPSSTVPWLPNTLRQIDMCRFLYPWRTTVPSSPFLAFSVPGLVSANCFRTSALKFLSA